MVDNKFTPQRFERRKHLGGAYNANKKTGFWHADRCVLEGCGQTWVLWNAFEGDFENPFIFLSPFEDKWWRVFSRVDTVIYDFDNSLFFPCCDISALNYVLSCKWFVVLSPNERPQSPTPLFKSYVRSRNFQSTERSFNSNWIVYGWMYLLSKPIVTATGFTHVETSVFGELEVLGPYQI